MIKIKSDKVKKLYFDLDISGTGALPEARLVLESTGMGLIFPATMKNGTANVTIPVLDPIIEGIKDKDFKIKLEVIVDNVYSVIWEDSQVEIEIPVKVSTKSPIIKEEKPEPKQLIKVKKISEKDEDDEEKDNPDKDVKPEKDDKSDSDEEDAPDQIKGDGKKKKFERKKVKVSMKEMFLGD